MPEDEASFEAIKKTLLALEPHSLDYESSLAIARSLREEVDWDEVRAETRASPYAQAFFTMLVELGIVGDRTPGSAS